MKSPGLFGRTALLVGGSIVAYTVVAWGAIVVFGILPGVAGTADLLAERTHQAMSLSAAHGALPPDVRVSANGPDAAFRFSRPALTGMYVRSLRNALRKRLAGAEVRIEANNEASLVWIQPADFAGRWIALRWPVAPEKALAIQLGVLLAAAGVVFVAAALYARRLAAPLRVLAESAARLSRGEDARVGSLGGPREFDDVASAFDAMAGQLREAEARRELMLAGISHDLRTPLARMRIAIELLDDRDAARRDSLAREIEEVDALAGRFLQFVRSGYAEAATPCRLDEVVRRALAPHLSEADVVLTLGAPDVVTLPAGAIARIAVNLVENALQYGCLPVSVATRIDAGYAELRVTDRGAGIDPVDWPLLLEPFRRSEPSPVAGHSGLGLATVARLVAASRGTLVAARDAEGFSIRVRLPFE